MILNPTNPPNAPPTLHVFNSYTLISPQDEAPISILESHHSCLLYLQPSLVPVNCFQFNCDLFFYVLVYE